MHLGNLLAMRAFDELCSPGYGGEASSVMVDAS